MTNTVHLGARVVPEVKEAMLEVAKQDHRTLSNMVNHALAEWLAAQLARAKSSGG